jgi:hypothetical protein
MTNRLAMIKIAARNPAPDSQAKMGSTWALVPLVVKGTVDDDNGSLPRIEAIVVEVTGTVVVGAKV